MNLVDVLGITAIFNFFIAFHLIVVYLFRKDEFVSSQRNEKQENKNEN